MIWNSTIRDAFLSIKMPVNHCCVVHDECYTLQLRQEKCDEDFCECNRLATITRNDCKDLLEATCSLVQLFGFGPYHSSANYTESADLVKYTVNADGLRTQYSNLYIHCPKVNATISSCALQYNSCIKTPIECAEALSHCLLDAAMVDGSNSCHETVNALGVLIIEEGNSWKNALQNIRFLGSNVLMVVMAACMLLLLCFLMRLRLSGSTIDEKGKKYFLV
ncbi:unnamed protein product [Cylicocyclus nassatus]|uniref:Uncharacterized protein n=1 Tax=Cylicocyclus nassatus TaxID=53992 RepID=A0AA36GG53_CYLNA|nr:unnamed protein product [Cylicocyclus nassatus]